MTSLDVRKAVGELEPEPELAALRSLSSEAEMQASRMVVARAVAARPSSATAMMGLRTFASTRPGLLATPTSSHSPPQTGPTDLKGGTQPASVPRGVLHSDVFTGGPGPNVETQQYDDSHSPVSQPITALTKSLSSY